MEESPVSRIFTLSEFMAKYGNVSFELWYPNKHNNTMYRKLTLGNQFPPYEVFVAHSLDNKFLWELYEDRDNLTVKQESFSDKDFGTAVLYKDAWEEVPPFNDDGACGGDGKMFVQTPEQHTEIQLYIKCALYYYAESVVLSYPCSSDREAIRDSRYHLGDYELYLQINYDEYDKLTKSLFFQSLELPDQVYGRMLRILRGSWEVKYLFYVLYLLVKSSVVSSKSVFYLGKKLGYSERNVRDFVSQVNVLLHSADSSIQDLSLLRFKTGVEKFARADVFCSITNIQSLIWPCSGVSDDTVHDAEDSGGYEYDTMGYWDISDEGLREGLDDDAGAYWNID